MGNFFGWVDLSWAVVLTHLAKLGIAYVLALPIGWDRERRSRSAGLRTFPLVSMATCAYMLLGIEVLSSTEAEGRALTGIITGMGFIGGGAILKAEGRVLGTATAASIWNTGAIGLAVAWNRLEIAILLCALNFVTLSVGRTIKDKAVAGEDRSTAAAAAHVRETATQPARTRWGGLAQSAAVVTSVPCVDRSVSRMSRERVTSISR